MGGMPIAHVIEAVGVGVLSIRTPLVKPSALLNVAAIMIVFTVLNCLH